MYRSYNEVKIKFDRFFRDDTLSTFINVPKQATDAADWNMKLDYFNVYQINERRLMLSQEDIPNLEKFSTVKIYKSYDRCLVRVTITSITAAAIHSDYPKKGLVEVKTTGKDNRIYIQTL